MVGIDIVDLNRFTETMQRTPSLARRFFSAGERAYCQGSANYLQHLAATFAAKESVMKALGLAPAAAWMRRIEVIRRPSGAPVARLEERLVEVSISHDRAVVVAVALALDAGPLDSSILSLRVDPVTAKGPDQPVGGSGGVARGDPPPHRLRGVFRGYAAERAPIGAGSREAAADRAR